MNFKPPPPLDDESQRLAVWRLFWALVGGLGAFLLFGCAHEYATYGASNRFAIVIGAVLLTSAVIGWLCRWGPLIPSVYCGIFVAALFAPATSHGPEETVYHVLGIPLVGAMIGYFVGLAVEFGLSSEVEK